MPLTTPCSSMNCVQILTTWGTAKNNLIMGVVMTMIMVMLMTVMMMVMRMIMDRLMTMMMMV